MYTIQKPYTMNEKSLSDTVLSPKTKGWFKACRMEDVPENGGVCVKYKDKQIAVFYFAYKNEWYATQNLCPHKQQMILSRGLLGESENEPKVACPFHKKTFSLRSGSCLSDPDIYQIKTYPVKIKDGYIFIGMYEDDV